MLKKLLCCLLALMLAALPALAEEGVPSEGPDLTAMTLSELQALYANVLAEIAGRSVPATPSASTQGEITFRNVPWGVNPETYLALVEEAGIRGNVQGPKKLYSWEWELSKGRLYAMDGLDKAGYTIESEPGELNVAGYPVQTVQAYFLHTADAEEVYTAKDGASLYAVRYTFQVVDHAAAFEMLHAKLTSLYGEGLASSDSSGDWSSSNGSLTQYTDAVVWYGANDTAVVLYHSYGIYDKDGSHLSHELKLYYGRSNSLTLMQELEAAMAREQLEEAADSMDGL